ncbi:hypothetical protein [Actinomycetospora chiangmaiensis]|uniref:hypothetical protein n=1 Tax=Actinomycetospora chiangmaiensis TaxID=402650 RepID=UPI000377852F|nr:hypothetical protein [Actinomycetospora chiangmaiensis]
MRRAVVVGGGFAGLLAARVLTDVAEEVVVVERDDLAGTGGDAAAAAPRRGVAQGAHLHGLLDGGRRILEELHPGITAELTAAGAPTAEPLRDTRWYLHGRRLAPTGTGLRSVLATRPFLEAALRRRTLAHPRVVLRDRTTVTGLLGPVGGAVTGVAVADRDGGSSLAADLVVDASGRGSRAPSWLTRLGHTAPAEDVVDVDLGYVTRLYRRAPDETEFGVTVSTVPRFRGGGAVAVEGGRWLVTLAGMLGDHPPTDPAAFEAWAATLPAPDVAAILARSQPLSDPVPYRFRGSRRRRFERLPDPPAGLVALGDALCSVNPLYAQGLSTAARHAALLAPWAAGARDPRAYFRAAAPVSAAAWDTATRADLALPEVRGHRPLAARPLDAYVARLQRVAHRDPVVARTVIRVANLADDPATLLAPGILARALRPGAARRRDVTPDAATVVAVG